MHVSDDPLHGRQALEMVSSIARLAPATQPGYHAAETRDGSKQANIPIPHQVIFVPINFGADDLHDALTGAGYRQDERTLFVWEGVTYYLSSQAVDAIVPHHPRARCPMKPC